MKVAGIIAEYNPFHKGHEYHISKTRETTGADYVIAVISGDFVQRGEPSVISKYHRTRQALLGGADLVIELPIVYATAGAEKFARGGISMLDALQVVDFVSFGTETDDLGKMSQLAKLLSAEPPEFKEELNKRLKAGETFPAAREAAVRLCLGDSPEIAEILNSPNNILALEYMKSLKTLGSKMEPVAVLRAGDGYNDSASGTGFASATGIREKLLAEGPAQELAEFVPEAVMEDFKESYGKEFPITCDDFVDLVGYKVKSLLAEGADLGDFEDLSEEIANRLGKLDITWVSYGEVCEALKTKQYTYGRISRSLIHILLGIKEVPETCGYARILGMRKEASELVRRISDISGIPVITKPSKAREVLEGEALSCFEKDVFASELYEERVKKKYGGDASRFSEYRQNLIIVE